jgi:hypothetical protein
MGNSDEDVGPKTYLWNFGDLPLTISIYVQYNGADIDDTYALTLQPYTYVELWDYVYNYTNYDTKNSDIEKYIVKYAQFGNDLTPSGNSNLNIPLRYAQQSEAAAAKIGDKHYDDSDNAVNIFFGMHDQDKSNFTYCANVPIDDNVWIMMAPNQFDNPPTYYGNSIPTLELIPHRGITDLTATAGFVNTLIDDPSISVNWYITVPYQTTESLLNQPMVRAGHTRLTIANGIVSTEWIPLNGHSITVNGSNSAASILNSITI